MLDDVFTGDVIETVCLEGEGTGQVQCQDGAGNRCDIRVEPAGQEIAAGAEMQFTGQV